MDFGSSTRAAENRTRWKGIVANSSVVPLSNDLPRLWDRIVLLYGKMLEYQVFNIWSHSHLLMVYEVFPETATAASLFGDDVEQLLF